MKCGAVLCSDCRGTLEGSNGSIACCGYCHRNNLKELSVLDFDFIEEKQISVDTINMQEVVCLVREMLSKFKGKVFVSCKNNRLVNEDMDTLKEISLALLPFCIMNYFDSPKLFAYELSACSCIFVTMNESGIKFEFMNVFGKIK